MRRRVVVDDLDEFLEPNPAAAATVQRIIDRGPDLGIRLIVSIKQLHDTDGDLWTVPAFGPAVRFRPDTVIAFSTFRREESMAALGHPGAWSLQRGQGHAYIRSATGLGDTPARIRIGSSDDAATLSAHIAAYQRR